MSLIKCITIGLVFGSIFIVLVLSFFKIYFSIQNEKRISAFALKTSEEDNLSFFDLFIKYIDKLLTRLSKNLNKSVFLKDYAKNIEKYLIYFDKKSLSGMKFIALKFLFMIMIDILYFLSLNIHFMHFNIYAFILVNAFSFFILDLFLIIYYKRKKKQIEDQLLQAIVIMNSAFKSGKNIFGAIEIVKNELSSPIKEEFEIIFKDLTCGLDISTCFARFYDRVNIEEAKYITSSLTLLSKTGGNIVTVFNMIEKQFYDRLKIKNELLSLTSTSRFLFKFLLVLPFFFVIIIVMLNPTYFKPLISTKVGYIFDIAMLLIYTIYIFIIKKVMKVETI